MHMKLAKLSDELIGRLKACRYDEFIDKHEYYDNWDLLVDLEKSNGIHPEFSLTTEDLAEFMEIDGHQVLLPIPRKQHPNITINRCICSDDRKVLTIFLKNSTWVPDDELEAGFLAICELFPEQQWYITTLYHERYDAIIK